MAKKNKDSDDLNSPKKRGLVFYLMLLAVVLILGAGGYMGAAVYFQLPPFDEKGPTPEEIAAQKAQEEKQEQLLQREIYVPCGSTFTFTVKSGRRLHTGQIEVVLVVQGEENQALAQKHLTLINSIIFDKLSSQSYEGLLLPSGRTRLKRELLDATRAKVNEVAKTPVIDQILFTGFVLQ